MTERKPSSPQPLFRDVETQLGEIAPEVSAPLQEAFRRHEKIADNEQTEALRRVEQAALNVAENVLTRYTKALSGQASEEEISELRAIHDTLEARGTSPVWDSREHGDQDYVEVGVAKKAAGFKGARKQQNREAGMTRQKLDDVLVQRRAWDEFGAVFDELRDRLDFGPPQSDSKAA